MHHCVMKSSKQPLKSTLATQNNKTIKTKLCNLKIIYCHNDSICQYRRSISKKIDLMLKDVCDLHDASNRRSKKKIVFPSNLLCYFKVKQSKPIIFILASRNLDEIKFNLL